MGEKGKVTQSSALRKNKDKRIKNKGIRLRWNYAGIKKQKADKRKSKTLFTFCFESILANRSSLLQITLEYFTSTRRYTYSSFTVADMLLRRMDESK